MCLRASPRTGQSASVVAARTHLALLVGHNDLVGSHLLHVLDLVLLVREGGNLGPERLGELDREVAETAHTFSELPCTATSAPMPAIATFLPGPQPLRLRGE